MAFNCIHTNLYISDSLIAIKCAHLVLLHFAIIALCDNEFQQQQQQHSKKSNFVRAVCTPLITYDGCCSNQ